jgi:H+/Cl- antiporter ClcA
MSNQDTNDWKPRQGWASNFRKYRWFNLVVPVLTPMGLISIFLFGYITFAAISLIVAAFAWFDLAKSAKLAWRRTAWKVFAVALVLFAGYMVFLYINPQYGM